MNYIDAWCKDVSERRPQTLGRAVKVTGLYDRHLGPRWAFAKIVAVCEPAHAFNVDVSGLSPKDADLLKNSGYLDALTFGFLDVAMTSPDGPLSALKLVLQEVEIDPINGSASAFRMAGRIAAENLAQVLRTS